MDVNLIRKLILKYGGNHQLLKLVEEMAELQKEILKYVEVMISRNTEYEDADNRKQIIEETAHVEMCLDQAKYIFDIKFYELQKVKDEKIKTLEV